MQEHQNSMSASRVSGLVFCLVVMLAAVAVAVWQGQAIGWPAFLLLCGMAVVAFLVVLILALSKSDGPNMAEGGAGKEAYFSRLFEHLPDPSLFVVDGRPEYASRSYVELALNLGVEASLAEPPLIDKVFNVSEKSASAAVFRLYHTKPEQGTSEETIRILAADGTFQSFDVRVNANLDGQFWQIRPRSGVGQDSALLSNAPVGLVSVTTDGEVLEINAVLSGWLGIHQNDQVTRLSEIVENPEILLDGTIAKGRTVRADTRLLTRKGVVTPTVMSAKWHEMDSGVLYASIAFYGHTGLGRQADRSADNPRSKMIDTQHSSGDVFADAPFGVLWLDGPDLTSTKILEGNSTIRAMLGRDSLTSLAFMDLFEPSDARTDFLANGVDTHDQVFDLALKGQAGRVVNVYFSNSRQFGLIAFVVDISARKSLETQLGQSQKMQAIGQLAGGVAHDFNNLLTAIRLNTDELLGRHPIGDPSYPELQKINQTVSRSAGLVRKLLAFSRKQTMRAEALDVTETLSDMGILLDQVLGERVKLDIRHGRGLPQIQADKNQLETVLMNLCVNARDAMLETGGGTIIMRSSKPDAVMLERENIESKSDNQDFVLIEVIDTGTGMDEETQQKIFEPFFTTKEQGKGTGLGMATVYGIVGQLGAQLRLDSALGVGTTFRLFMPLASEDIIKTTASAKPKPVAPVKPTDLAGTGSILFVEDEIAVRSIAAKTLRKRGYTVTEAGDGEEAYEILETMGTPFDLMISDVVMPGMDGPTLLKKGRALLGDAHIVFISGYAQEEFSDLLAEEPDVTFLPKPFTLKELAEKVKSVLVEGD